ncbi:DUF2254 domain-containing protein [Evansella sp. AB-P1]|uniref:DUF2254 domain-containing protein n=1 Tax=Evansella sp. AB-P1 TaxID=3037653 RepID=UPI00241DB348|nr:DUF2254 domain-containing protein [Evansella sp. AB-P1]MDG5790052.1 DUF2254 domain-containing protein [Evansella sp. AB-P1]
MTLKGILIKIRSSFWYIPSLFGAFAVVLALVSLEVDSLITANESILRIIPVMLLTDLDLAQTILSSISASLLTMTTITFSTILVVLTTFLSEFSPRTLQNFITDNKTQSVLGVFVGGFVYSILLLLLLRENETTNLFIVPSFAVLFAIICLVVFVFFIHYVSRWMQVSNLIHEITYHTIKKIDNEFKDMEDVHEDAPWEDWESEELFNITPRKILSDKAGYIKYIDLNGLLKQATNDDCIIQIERKISEYVDNDTVIFSLWIVGNSRDLSTKNYLKYIAVGTEKTPVENIDFGITKIVEITLRALSPGINDPNTAINGIENLGKVLSKLGSKYLPKSYLNDSNRNLRVMMDRADFSDYLYKSFYQIRQSGFNDISVLSAGIKALTFIAENNSKKIKEVIWEFAEYIIEGIDEEKLLTLDRKYINRQLEKLARSVEHKHNFKGL